MTKIEKTIYSRVINIGLLLLLQVVGFVGNFFETSSCCSSDHQTPYPKITCQSIVDTTGVQCLQAYLHNVSINHDTFKFALQQSNASLLDDDFFQQFNINHFEFTECGLTEVPMRLFQGTCDRIEYLAFEGNHITSIPDGTFQSCTILNTIDLEYNLIEVILANTFQGVGDTLIQLYLTGNKLNSVDENAFANVGYLRAVYLGSNALTTLVDGTFQRVESLMAVYLADNPFVCNCSLKWLQTWMNSNNIVADDPTCDIPPDISKAIFCTDDNETTLVPPSTTTTTTPAPTGKITVTSWDTTSAPSTIYHLTTIVTPPPTIITPSPTPAVLLITDFTLTDDLAMGWSSPLQRVTILYGPINSSCSEPTIHGAFGNASNQMHLFVTEDIFEYQAELTSYDDITRPYLACVTVPIDLEHDVSSDFLASLICGQNCRTTSRPPTAAPGVPNSGSSSRNVLAIILVSALGGIVLAIIVIGGVALIQKNRRKKKLKKLEKKLLLAAPWKKKPPVRPREGTTDSGSAYIEPSIINPHVAAFRGKKRPSTPMLKTPNTTPSNGLEALYNNSYVSLDPSLYLTLAEVRDLTEQNSHVSHSYCSLNSKRDLIGWQRIKASSSTGGRNAPYADGNQLSSISDWRSPNTRVRNWISGHPNSTNRDAETWSSALGSRDVLY